MATNSGGTRRIEVDDPDPMVLKEQIRASLYSLIELIALTNPVIASGAGAGREDCIGDLAATSETISILIHGIGSSIRSIITLTENIDLGIRDCYGIARSICESSINVAYILAGGNDIATKAQRHAMQKSYRAHARVYDIGDFKVGGTDVPPASEIPGMQEALSEYTRRNGTEITEWSGLNLQQKTEFIVNKYPGLEVSLEGSISTIYRVSSEILHGTYAGAELFWTAGGHGAPTEQSFAKMWSYNHLATVFTAVWTSSLAMIEAVEQEYGASILGVRKLEWLKSARDIFNPVVLDDKP